MNKTRERSHSSPPGVPRITQHKEEEEEKIRHQRARRRRRKEDQSRVTRRDSRGKGVKLCTSMPRDCSSDSACDGMSLARSSLPAAEHSARRVKFDIIAQHERAIAPSMVKLKRGGKGLPLGIVASAARRLCGCQQNGRQRSEQVATHSSKKGCAIASSAVSLELGVYSSILPTRSTASGGVLGRKLYARRFSRMHRNKV